MSEIEVERRPPMPPKRPLFGMRIHPIVLILSALALVALALLICMATNPALRQNMTTYWQLNTAQ